MLSEKSFRRIHTSSLFGGLGWNFREGLRCGGHDSLRAQLLNHPTATSSCDFRQLAGMLGYGLEKLSVGGRMPLSEGSGSAGQRVSRIKQELCLVSG